MSGVDCAKELTFMNLHSNSSKSLKIMGFLFYFPSCVGIKYLSSLKLDTINAVILPAVITMIA